MNFALRLPDYYKPEIESLKGDISMNQFIVTAVAEKIAALKTEDYLKQRALQGDRSHALSMLDQVADIAPDKQDKL